MTCVAATHLWKYLVAYNWDIDLDTYTYIQSYSQPTLCSNYSLQLLRQKQATKACYNMRIRNTSSVHAKS